MIYIEQPAFLPWLGFCEALFACDAVALFDDVQFVERGWQNRNRIKTANGVEWLTVPVEKSHGQPIREVRLSQDFDSAAMLRKLAMAYGRCRYYEETIQVVEPSLSAKPCWLLDLNIELLNHIAAALGARAQLRITSSLAVPPSTSRSGRLVDICRAFGSTRMWAGSGTSGYLDVNLFLREGITITWNNFGNRHPCYDQHWKRQGFVPGMSVVDAACNIGWAGVSAVLRAGLDEFWGP